MAVFRIERTRDYTVMSNHHLRDKALSLKSKGLLSMMLSLPEDWNYTTRGLAKICKEGVDAIGGALRELESAGYIVRHQMRDRQGRISDTEYQGDWKKGIGDHLYIPGRIPESDPADPAGRANKPKKGGMICGKKKQKGNCGAPCTGDRSLLPRWSLCAAFR